MKFPFWDPCTVIEGPLYLPDNEKLVVEEKRKTIFELRV